MGDNRWRDEQEWPLARAHATPFYLHSGGAAQRARRRRPAESSAPAAADETPRHVHLRPGEAGADRTRSAPTRAMPADRRDIQKRRRRARLHLGSVDRSRSRSPVPVQLVLWASSSATDTDFTAALSDVHPDGTARALTDGILRARYRDSRTTPALLTPGQRYEFTIDVGATSNVFLPGHGSGSRSRAATSRATTAIPTPARRSPPTPRTVVRAADRVPRRDRALAAGAAGDATDDTRSARGSSRLGALALAARRSLACATAGAVRRLPPARCSATRPPASASRARPGAAIPGPA